eukprot:TRINITY_DN14154_c0_g1_i1.p1 TRINITY_DN14154_c0_g1~~TRINITY_DN14154_c0_g1_i1.p1  ORF type:complete len:257 (+),score=37.07 TRINITY_DN14154_c0_g1_i1:92-862(+)
MGARWCGDGRRALECCPACPAVPMEHNPVPPRLRLAPAERHGFLRTLGEIFAELCREGDAQLVVWPRSPPAFNEPTDSRPWSSKSLHQYMRSLTGRSGHGVGEAGDVRFMRLLAAADLIDRARRRGAVQVRSGNIRLLIASAYVLVGKMVDDPPRPMRHWAQQAQVTVAQICAAEAAMLFAVDFSLGPSIHSVERMFDGLQRQHSLRRLQRIGRGFTARRQSRRELPPVKPTPHRRVPLARGSSGSTDPRQRAVRH